MSDEKTESQKLTGKSIIPIVSNQRFFPSEMVKADPNTRLPLIGVRCPLCFRSIIAVYQDDGVTRDKCGECGYNLEDIVWKPLVKALFGRTRFEKAAFWFQTQALRGLRFFARKKTTEGT